MLVRIFIRETKKDNPFPFPLSPPLPRFSTGWLFFKTKKRQNEQVASIIPACTLWNFRDFLVPLAPPHNKGVLARATDRANFKYRVFLKYSGKRRDSVVDGRKGEKKKGGRGWRLAETSCKDFWSCSRVTSSFCRDYGTRNGGSWRWLMIFEESKVEECFGISWLRE